MLPRAGPLAPPTTHVYSKKRLQKPDKIARWATKDCAGKAPVMIASMHTRLPQQVCCTHTHLHSTYRLPTWKRAPCRAARVPGRPQWRVPTPDLPQ